MHEAGIADRILDLVIAQARQAGAPRIVAVNLEAGILAAVSEEALRFHWEQHAAGTPAEGAVLNLELTDELTDLRLVSIDVEDDPNGPGVRAEDGDRAPAPAGPGGGPGA